jgi:hypothetical protein
MHFTLAGFHDPVQGLSATINVGKKDRVAIGMQFFADHLGTRPEIFVVGVGENTSLILIVTVSRQAPSWLKPGIKLSTRDPLAVR